MVRPVYYIVLVEILLSLMFVACDENNDNHAYRIGVSQCSGGFWREKQNNEMRRELLLQEGATMELLCANDDNEKQMADIQHFIDEQVDILVVSPNDTNALTATIEKAYHAGIPVLLFDRTIHSDQYTAFVGGDNYEVGRQMAAYIITHLPKGGKVIEIMGYMKTSPAWQRHRGFVNGLSDVGGIDIVASVDAGWQGPLAESAADSLLRLYPDVDAIVSHSDFMADGAKRAADRLFPGNDYIFVGADGFGTPGLGIEAVEKGELDATAIYPTGGDAIIQTALKILKGEQYEKTTFLPSNIVSTPQEAMLLINMDRALTAEVKRVERVHDKAVFYLKESQKERVMLYVLLAVLVLICGLCAALYRVNMLRRKSNKRLYEQQDKLLEKNEQLLSMTHQLEEATNAKLVFFTNISHDFRTPLNLISGPIDQAMAKLKDKAEIMTLLQIAQRNVGVLLDLVNQILDFRKVENGKMTLTMQTVNINTLASAWHESFMSLAQQKGLKLDVAVDKVETNVNVDAKKLERMVYNLLGNSIKFTPAGGTVGLRCTMADNHLVITVSDTGPGIDKDNLNKIFERFYQLGNSSGEGTGIGLALVKKYAELMGGSVEIASNSDDTQGATGTTISIVIPTEPSHVAAPVTDVPQHLLPESLYACANLQFTSPAKQQQVSEDESLPVVLVIDDNADMRTFISTLLADRYRVLTANDGEQGLQIAKDNIPDIVVCDVMMPVMDGLECCQKLKNDLCTSHIPVILLTACSLDEQRVKGLESGAEAYLAKPFNCSVLLAQIDTLLKNRTRENLSKTNAEVKDSSASKQAIGQHVSKPSLSRYDKGFMKKMQEHIENCYSDENFCVEMLAEKMCLSRAQLYRKCKALTGNTPVELIRNTRLEHARQMLLNGYDQIAHVAAAVGIPNAAYFAKCYKAYFGDYPKDTMS